MAAPRKVEFVIGAVDRTRAIFRRVRRGVAGMARSITSFRAIAGGVFAGAAIRGLTRFAEGLETIEVNARSLNLTSEQFQALQFAAEDVGIAASNVATVFQRLNRRTGEALNGNDLILKKFIDLGITLEDLKELSPAEIWDKATASARKMGRAVGDARIAALFDVEGLRFARLTGQEFENIGDMIERARAAGAILGPKEIQAARDFAQAMRELRLQFAKEIAPDLLKFARLLTKEGPTIVKGMAALVIAVRELVGILTAIPKIPGRIVDAGIAKIEQFKTGQGTSGGRVITFLVQKGLEDLREIREISARAERRGGGNGGAGVFGA